MGDCGTRLIREPHVSGFKGLQGRIPFRMDGALNPNPAGSGERHSRDGSSGLEATRGRLPASERCRSLRMEFHGRAESRLKARDRRRGPDRCARRTDRLECWNESRSRRGRSGEGQAGDRERLRAVGQVCLGTETSERPGGAQAGRSGVHDHGRHQAPLSSAGGFPGAQTLAPVRGVVKGGVDSRIRSLGRRRRTWGAQPAFPMACSGRREVEGLAVGHRGGPRGSPHRR